MLTQSKRKSIFSWFWGERRCNLISPCQVGCRGSGVWLFRVRLTLSAQLGILGEIPGQAPQRLGDQVGEFPTTTIIIINKLKLDSSSLHYCESQDVGVYNWPSKGTEVVTPKYASSG